MRKHPKTCGDSRMVALEGWAFSGDHIDVFPSPRESAPQHPARQAQPWLMLNLPGKPAYRHSSLKALSDSRVLHRTGASKNFMRQRVCPHLPGPLQKGEQFRQLWSQRKKKFSLIPCSWRSQGTKGRRPCWHDLRPFLPKDLNSCTIMSKTHDRPSSQPQTYQEPIKSDMQLVLFIAVLFCFTFNLII